jgi:RNA polymerase sigma-70 factor, ECF subfamily
MSDDEKALLLLARKGNIDAFETLIQAYQKKVYNIVLKACGHEEDASELTQEVFVRVFRALKHQKGDIILAVSIYKNVRDVCMESVGNIRMIS